MDTSVTSSEQDKKSSQQTSFVASRKQSQANLVVEDQTKIELDFKTYKLPTGSKNTLEFLYLVADLKLAVRIPGTLLLSKTQPILMKLGGKSIVKVKIDQ